MSIPDKVLVIGDDTRSFLTTVRSLGRQGLQVHVVPYNMSSPSLASRYIAKMHFLPYYLDGGAQWLHAMVELLRSEKFSLVVPCDERSLLPLLTHRSVLEAYSKLSIPDEHGLELFFDKLKTREMAAALNIPVAHGRLLTDGDTVTSILADVRLPLIIKYRKSYSWPELYVRTSVKLVLTEGQLAEWLEKNPKRGSDLLVEQIFEGFGIGLSVLCDRGCVLQAFEHHRVREIQGSSYYRKSMPIDASRQGAVAKMVAHAGFTGIAMFEFKANAATGQWILLEVNARPWGSLPLPVALGVDFPYRLYRLLVKEEATPAVSYRQEVYGRNFVPDLWQMASVAKTLARRPGALSAHVLRWILEFRRLFNAREYQDVWVRDDPQPGWRDFKDFTSSAFQSLRSKLVGPAPLPTGLRKKIRAMAMAGNQPVNILFLCQGNICRSPYAELKLRQLLAGRHADCEVQSAGMLPRNRRPSPGVAVQAAGKHGVNLTLHRSRHACEQTIRAASVIVLFDRINWSSLNARYPSSLDKAYFLGEFANLDEKVIEVLDPEGQSEAAFDATYRQIDQCLERLVAALPLPAPREAFQ